MRRHGAEEPGEHADRRLHGGDRPGGGGASPPRDVRLRTSLLAVGKLRASYRSACDEYLKRLTRFGRVEEREIREASRAPTQAARVREETERLRAALPERAQVIVLDRRGSAWSSEELARKVSGWREGGKAVVLVIGGASGLDPEFVRSADVRWSLGPLTLPHELARVVVLEQWYRAHTILHGLPYHKGHDS